MSARVLVIRPFSWFRVAVGGLLLAVPLAAQAAPGRLIQHTYRFDATSLVVRPGAAGTQVEAGGLVSTWEAGEPPIPFDTVTLLVPQGSSVARVSARPAREHLAHEGLELSPASSIFDTDGNEHRPPQSRLAGAAKAGEPSLYPRDLAKAVGMGRLHGYQFVVLQVYPIRFESAAGRLWVSDEIEIEVELADGADLPLQRERYSAEIEDTARRTLLATVGNPEALQTYERRIGVNVEATRRGFHPADAPSLEGSPVSYVIITNQALEASFQVLADWKTSRGIPTVVRTREWIAANYRNGSDLQETIRTFIRDAYTKWGVEYVALAGDTDVIPARYGYSLFGPPADRDIPTDMYFACLDGNWNADGDAYWGEAEIDSLTPGDDLDVYAEVYVGRLPVSTPGDAADLIDKIITYEDPSITNYQDEVVALGEVLFPVDWEPGQAPAMDGGTFSDVSLGHLPACATVTRYYSNYTQYPGSLPLSLAATLDAMNAGCGFVNHIGHGYRYNMSVGDYSLVNSHAAALTNGERRFVLYMLNCTATAFDFPCLAEEFLKAEGGAVAVFGASRAAYPLPVFNYNREFFEALHDSSIVNCGRTFVQSRLDYTPNAFEEGADHYSHLLYNFLGDPEMIIHTCELAATVVSHPSNIPKGGSNVLVDVSAGGNPVAGARVCLMKGVEEYVYGLTDANGEVTLEFVAESAGTVQIMVSGQNITTWSGSMSVDATGGAYVHSTAIAIDDDNVNNSLGNADGILDGGEVVHLNVTFRNDGNTNATNVTGVCRVASQYVTVIDSTYTVGSVLAGNTASITDDIRLLVAVSAPDGAVLPVELRSTNGSSVWVDVVNKVVHAPVMELTLWSIDDPNPGGNDDGVIQAGETFNLIPSVKNYGTGTAPGVEVEIFTGDPDVVVTTGLLNLGNVASMQEVAQAPGFRVTENVLGDNIIVVLVTDARNRFWTWNVTLRGPQAPGAPVLDASQSASVVVATWPPSAAPDLAGYHLYRSTTGSAPWSRVTQDRTLGVAYFRNGGLQPSTNYFYYVTAVDSSGNESAPSPVSNVNTQPPQLSGWPIAMANVSSCPLAVADITGDGVKEILAGNKGIYAWDWHGEELTDDDEDPQTWGVFVSEVQIVAAAIVAAELDDTPGFELFAASWEDTNSVFLVRGDGSIAPGWPQKPDPTTPQKGYWASPLAADVDGDGFCEVFAAGKNGNIYAWHADGSPLGATARWKQGLGTWTRSSPIAANLDADPAPEIIYVTPGGTLQAWNADGSNVAHFPVTLGTLSEVSPAAGDVNNDGVIDIVALTSGSSTGKVHVIDSSTGLPLPGWPVTLSQSNSGTMAPSPALADFNFDGFLEIVTANNSSPLSEAGVRVYNYQGTVQPGWPRTTNFHTSESSPIVADVSGDGIPDILFGNEDGKIFGWDKDGNDLIGFPLTVGDHVRSTPFADDVDNDGDIDVVLAGWDSNVWIWDFAAPYSAAAAQWPTLKNNSMRNGNYHYRAAEPTDVDPEPDVEAAVPARPVLSQNVPNPFNPITAIEYGVPAGGGGMVDVYLHIYDVQGRRVRDLVQGPQRPGMHTAQWDGRDNAGRRVQTGVYFYRLLVGAESVTRKMTLLK